MCLFGSDRRYLGPGRVQEGSGFKDNSYNNWKSEYYKHVEI